MHTLMYPWTRPRNGDFEWRGWSVDVCLDWNASSGWRDKRCDVDWNGDVDIFDVTKVNSKYGKDVGDSRWDLVCDLNGDDTYIKVEIWCKIQADPEGWQYMGVTFKTETFTENTILNATRWNIFSNEPPFNSSKILNVKMNGMQEYLNAKKL